MSGFKGHSNALWCEEGIISKPVPFYFWSTSSSYCWQRTASSGLAFHPLGLPSCVLVLHLTGTWPYCFIPLFISAPGHGHFPLLVTVSYNIKNHGLLHSMAPKHMSCFQSTKFLGPEEHFSINALVCHRTNDLQGQPSNPDNRMVIKSNLMSEKQRETMMVPICNKNKDNRMTKIHINTSDLFSFSRKEMETYIHVVGHPQLITYPTGVSPLTRKHQFCSEPSESGTEEKVNFLSPE